MAEALPNTSDSCPQPPARGPREAAVRALLALMCDGRLMATDWLNEVRRAASAAAKPAGALWTRSAPRARPQARGKLAAL